MRRIEDTLSNSAGPPRAFPNRPDRRVGVLPTCCHRSEQSRDGDIMNRRIEVSTENKLASQCGAYFFFFLKIQWLCISLGSLVESGDYSNLRAVLVELMGLMFWKALWAQYGYIYTGNIYDCTPYHTTPDRSTRLSPIAQGLRIDAVSYNFHILTLWS